MKKVCCKGSEIMDLNIIYLILGILFLVSSLLFFIVKKKEIKVVSGIVGCAVIIITCLVSFSPLFDAINYGLDLQGGFEVLYEVSSLNEDEKLDSDMVNNTYKSLLKRIDILGVSEPEITIEGDNRIRVRLAGVTNKEEAREVLSSTASLTFRDTSNHLLMTSDVLGGNAKVTIDKSGKPAVSLSIKDKDTFYDVTSRVSKMKNNMIVIWLDYEEGVDSYSKESKNCGSLGNSKCLSAARVDQGFASDVIIQGNFSEEEATSLVELINSGALPTKLDEISSRTVEASFGISSLNKTLVAGAIGILIVILLMIVIYRFSGFVASIGVLLYTVLTFLIFYLINGVLTLPGIAAILLGIGMAVDSNVIIFERIKEQLKIGVGLKEAYKIGNNESLSSVVDANITTMIVAVILFIFGESSVKGFATMLIISIIVTVLIMVFLVRYLLGLFVNTDVFDNHLNLFVGVSKKKIKKAKEIIIPFKKLEFVRNRKYFLGLTIILTTVTVNKNEEVDLKSLRKDFEEFKYTIKKEEETDNDITITIKEVLDKDDIKSLSSEIEDRYDTNTDIYTVSKIVKQDLTKNAIYSLVIACIGILIYVAFRFKFNYAVAAIIALVHDSLVIFLFFCLFRLEITTIFIAAVLTIIGYSINDTIVTFDMIRENYNRKLLSKGKNNSKKKKNDVLEVKLNEEELISIVNDSVRLTLFRSILTTLTTIIPVICLMILGAREIVNFNIALLVGFIAGVYSSIYVSNQIWLMLEVRKLNKPKKEKKNDDDEVEELQVKGINC